LDETVSLSMTDNDFYASYCDEYECMNKIAVPHLPERCFFCLQELCGRELIFIRKSGFALKNLKHHNCNWVQFYE